MTDPPPPTPVPRKAIPAVRSAPAGQRPADPAALGPRPADPVALTALLAEYNSLRTESLQAISNRIQIMNFAFTSLAVITAAMITSDLPRGILIPACLLFVPGAAKASLLIWLGEYHRSQRAGQGVAAVERRINSLLGAGDVLGWESRLVSSGTHMGYPYIATAVFILSTGVLAQSLGGYFLVGRLAPSPTLRDDLAVVGGVLLYAVLCETLFLRFFVRRWRAIRSATHSG
ncbi:hypothetical protein OG288_04100 [Streptomyces tauricus]|uniref:Integral membrane protein n=1 Tax=Streptomyces tauricus TaxID=68274 RepID=A0ABZ1JAK4_9ACTN|nr:hypothetical protein [Streptomyces tauricus]MCW8098165.1 hypothetical protein [Streptomyces tauricus]